MNKKFLILPVISALLLAGCTMGRSTKKRKKSSSVESSQSVTPGPGGTSVVPGGSSQQPGGTSQQPGGSSQIPAASSQTPAGSSQTPSGSSQTPTPTEGWDSQQISDFQASLNVVPPYYAALEGIQYDSTYYEWWVIADGDIHAAYAALLTGWTAGESGPGTFDPEEGEEEGLAYMGYQYYIDANYTDPETGDKLYCYCDMKVYDDSGTCTQVEFYLYSEPEGGGGGGGGGDLPVEGVTVTLKNQENRVSLSDTEAVYQSDSWTVTIGKGSASQTVTEAVTASKTFEMRLYQNFTATFAGGTFNKLEVVYSTYVSNSKTYYFDFDITGAEKVLDNEYDTANTQGKATFTFSSAQTSVTVTASHQARVTSVTFFA